MKVNIYPIYSSLHDYEYISKITADLLNDLRAKTNFDYEIVSFDKLYDSDLSLILVCSGGSEAVYIEIEDKVKKPVIILTFATNNSLAASLEILTYIQNKGEKGEILHGSSDYIAQRIISLMEKKDA